MAEYQRAEVVQLLIKLYNNNFAGNLSILCVISGLLNLITKLNTYSSNKSQLNIIEVT